MKNLFKFLTFSLLLALITTSCSSDDDSVNPPVSLGDYQNGIIVSAEGGPASISYISNDFSVTENNVYENVNGEAPGVYLQSVGFNGNLGYIISDNVNTINIVNRYTFEKEDAITTGLQTPRYIGFANGKGYVSNWGDGVDDSDDFIAVVDLSTNSVETTIPIGEGPERVLVHNGNVYVSHKGGWGNNNIISVIDVSTNAVATITVGDVPDELFINNAGELVVLSEGKAAWTGDETVASISKIDLSTNTVSESLTFANGAHPSQMAFDNGTIYYVLNNEVYEMPETVNDLPTSSIINLGSINTYGLAVNNGNVYVTDAKDFASQGDLLIYDINTGELTNTFEVGINASKVYFN
ncbi:YncE family protein [Hanstruepera flava]|uniref:YncE family protein n=1 Tax=Hanstruepera flava TaxID=2930218 RepID=UPI00202821E7|nr:YncE family protein [Hanstruepera flava]